MPNTEEALAKVPFFADLSSRDLKRLAALCVPKRFDAGAEILSEGAVGLGLFLITAGEVEVFKTEDGRRRRLAVLGTGDVLGEMALIDERPRSASAVALESTTALLLSRDGFETVVERSPAVAWAMVPELAARLRDAQDRLIEAEARADARGHEVPASGDGGGGSDRFLAAPFAALMSGMAGSMKVARSSTRAFARATGVDRGRDPLHVISKMPEGAWRALSVSLAEAGRIPGDMMDAFLDSANGSGEDA